MEVNDSRWRKPGGGVERSVQEQQNRSDWRGCRCSNIADGWSPMLPLYDRQSAEPATDLNARRLARPICEKGHHPCAMVQDDRQYSVPVPDLTWRQGSSGILEVVPATAEVGRQLRGELFYYFK
jgi:hypothetical protein